MTRPIEYSLTFSGAGEQEIQARGKHILINDASGVVFVSINHGSELLRGKKSNIAAGEEINRIRFRSLVAQTIRFTVSDEKQEEGRDDVSVTASATIVPGNTFAGLNDVTLPATTPTKIADADATRLGLIIKNPGSNTASVRIGGASSVGATQGIEIDPGESMPVATTAEVWAYSVPGETVSLAVVLEI